jgi:D-alanyl-D-alanine endopeptidase (penicillin-binding protein 7)
VVSLANGRTLQYRNSNGLIKSPNWSIGLSKTGYISEAGRCLVMQTVIASTPMVIVLLDSWGKYSRIGDANRIKKWIESNVLRQPAG